MRCFAHSTSVFSGIRLAPFSLFLHLDVRGVGTCVLVFVAAPHPLLDCLCLLSFSSFLSVRGSFLFAVLLAAPAEALPWHSFLHHLPLSKKNGTLVFGRSWRRKGMRNRVVNSLHPPRGKSEVVEMRTCTVGQRQRCGCATAAHWSYCALAGSPVLFLI
eukprot:RCo044356